MSKRRFEPGPGREWLDDVLPTELAESSIFRFEVQLGDQTITLDLLADVDVNYEMLEEQLAAAPSQFAYWGAMYSELKFQVAVKERQLKAKRGRLINDITSVSKEDKLKLSVDQVKAVIEMDKTLNRLEFELALLQKQAGKLWYMTEAMRMRAESLRSLAGFKRQEKSETRN